MNRFFESELDVLICSAPNLRHWPKEAVQTLMRDLTRENFRVGAIDSSSKASGIQVTGVISNSGSGGLAIAQDVQKRIHQIRAKSIIAITNYTHFVYGFLGNHTRAVLGGDVAEDLLDRKMFPANKPNVILGSSNHAFAFGIRLLERGCPKVTIVNPTMAGKRIHWEALERRFLMLGGVVVHAQPQEIRTIGVDLCELVVMDALGRRVLESAKIVSYHPESHLGNIEESSPGSLLFRWWVTHSRREWDDPQGFSEAREYSGELAQRILSTMGAGRAASRGARRSLKKIRGFLQEQVQLKFESKWLSHEQDPQVHFGPENPSGVALECFEKIGCKVCHDACPERAIALVDSTPKVLADLCTQCGKCLQACPAAVPVLVETKENETQATLTLSVRGKTAQEVKERRLVDLLNRRGEKMGQGRVLEVKRAEEGSLISLDEALVKLSVAAHLVQEVRTIRTVTSATLDQEFQQGYSNDVYSKFERESIDLWVAQQKRRALESENVARWLTSVGLHRPEDRLQCSDGTCGLCKISLDGIRVRACEAKTRANCHIEIKSSHYLVQTENKNLLCPCLGILTDEVENTLKAQPRLSYYDLVERLGVGSGRCHGQLCFDHLTEIYKIHARSQPQAPSDISNPEGFWRFPWFDWSL